MLEFESLFVIQKVVDGSFAGYILDFTHDECNFTKDIRMAQRFTKHGICEMMDDYENIDWYKGHTWQALNIRVFISTQ